MKLIRKDNKKHIFKICFVLCLLFSPNGYSNAGLNSRFFNAELDISDVDQQIPFSFFNPVPSQIRLNDRIDLSFTVNNEIVSQYRYRLEVPKGAESSINKSFQNWSDWINEAFSDIILLKIGKEGRYKLTVEYKNYINSDIKKFERSFDVLPVTMSTSAADQTTVPNLKSKTNNPVESSSQSNIDYEKLLSEAIQKKDSSLFRISIENGAGIHLKGLYGGNIFHMMPGLSSDEKLIVFLTDQGVSLNEPDNYGNTPLHVAIMQRQSLYARSLINQGAELKIINRVGLAPLHLTAFLNDSKVTSDIIRKGTDLNIKGNSGYTPLHIASLMNNTDVARELLAGGASTRVKTDQKLLPKTIARIQNNREMVKLIDKKGNYTKGTGELSSATSTASVLNAIRLTPQFEINLQYNKELLKKRQFAKVVQIISVPVAVLSTTGAAYMKSEADNYYSLYKNAETMDLAQYYYDKTMKYDTYTYIFGGISIVSLYSFIHSTVSKKKTTSKMRKTLY